ncbi:hypothetical protein EMPS_01051 [Entomortierella parvispora]|uniref:DUF7707 domain-containing protein n=1 Tax=Entomortierella parvispora TaxID=205924 RepID=A0A9P3H287_9FUNG|nr:hypothetical protein EMPS_01051 [Entomortierella parvispora]
MIGTVTSRTLRVLAIAIFASAACVAAFDPQSVNNITRLTWCEMQVGFCTNVCQELTNGAQYQLNDCNTESLAYDCICEGNVVPNVTEYTLTIPYFECVTDVQNCIGRCPQSDNGCYSVCKQRNCTAEFPKKYNQTLPTALATPTSTGNFPSGTGLPPSIFGSAASSSRMSPYWATSVGGSSLLGLVVFLTVGVMFADHRSE